MRGRETGIGRTIFRFEHTCATLLLRERTPVHVVSERLGHSTVAMTMEV